MKTLFNALYKSEINASLDWFWDSGFVIKIGDNLNGFTAELYSDDLNQLEIAVEKKVKELYPNSKFAKTYTKDKIDFEKAVTPAIRYLLQNHHPHTSIHISYANAELLEGLKGFNLNNEIPD